MQVSFCAVIPHYQITRSFRDSLNSGTFQEVALPQKGKFDPNSGKFDILEFTDGHLEYWQKHSKNLDSKSKKNLALRLFDSFKQEMKSSKKNKQS